MKITTDRDKLIYAFNLFQRTRVRKIADILIKRDSLAFHGMDDGITVELSYPADIDSFENIKDTTGLTEFGNIDNLQITPDSYSALEAFFGTIESSGPKVNLTIQEESIKFNGELPTGGKRQATMKCEYDYHVPNKDNDPEFTFDISPFDLLSLINTWNFADKDDHKLSNMRVFGNSRHVVSETADGYKIKRSGIIDDTLSENLNTHADLLLPAHTLHRLVGIIKDSEGEIQVQVFENKITLTGEVIYENTEYTYKLSVQRANSPWPELDKIMAINIGNEIMDYPVLFTIEKSEVDSFKNAITTALRFTDSDNPHLHLRISEGDLHIFAKASEVGDIKIKVEGYEVINYKAKQDSIVMAINGTWLRGAINGEQLWGIDDLNFNDNGFCIGKVVAVEAKNGEVSAINGLMIIPLSPNIDITQFERI